MKLKKITLGLLFGVILVILNSCGENSQPAAIEEKPKDTVKVEDEVVLKIEELDSVFVSLSGVKGKYLREVYNSQSNPTTVNSEYINDFNFYGKFYLRQPYIANSKQDSLVYGDNSGKGDMFLITKNKQSNLFDFNFFYHKIEINGYGGTNYYGSLVIEKVKLTNDSNSIYFEQINPRIDTLISSLSYIKNASYLKSGPDGYMFTEKISFHSITEISDSAKISIRIVKKKK